MRSRTHARDFRMRLHTGCVEVIERFWKVRNHKASGNF